MQGTTNQNVFFGTLFGLECYKLWS